MGITECYEYDDLVRLNDYLIKMNFNYRELLNVSNDIPYTLDIDFMSFQPSDIKKSIYNFNEKNKYVILFLILKDLFHQIKKFI